MIRALSIFLLLYPSVPFFRIGWGQNIPFLIASLIVNLYFVRQKTIRFDRSLLLLFASIVCVIIATFIMREKMGYFTWVVPLVGMRELAANFSILLSLFYIVKSFSISFVLKGLLGGLIFNLAYGVLEVLYQPISDHEFVFHAPLKNDDYLLKESNARIRLLWVTPTMAATYLAMMIPLVFAVSSRIRRALLWVAWTAAFVKVGSKGVLFFFLLTPIASLMIFPRAAMIFIVKRIWLIGVLAAFGVLAALLLESEFVFTAGYVLDIVEAMFNPRIYTFNLEDLYSELYNSRVAQSQYIRFVTLAMAIQNFLAEPYAMLTGFSPWGAKFYYILNPQFVPEYLIVAKFLTRFNSEELSLAKPIIESSFVDSWVSYGLPMLVFMLHAFFKSFSYLARTFPRYRDAVWFLAIWMFLSHLFMLTENAFVLFYVYRIVAEKLYAESKIRLAHSKKGVSALGAGHAPLRSYG